MIIKRSPLFEIKKYFGRPERQIFPEETKGTLSIEFNNRWKNIRDQLM